jgi:uncharacterized protein (TIGR00159 family)
LKGSIAFNIFIGLMLLYVTWWLVSALKMQLLSTFLSQFVSVGVILLIIIFQPEIRRFLLDLGNSTLKRRSNLLKRLIDTNLQDNIEQNKIVFAIKEAILNLSSRKTGALVVFNKGLDQSVISQSSVTLNANVNAGILESIFHKDSPLHDGAVIIQSNKIESASAVLPVSENQHLPKGIGLRHRAGVGITENSDAATIIVSEENGKISTAYKGSLQLDCTEKDLESFIRSHL